MRSKRVLFFQVAALGVFTFLVLVYAHAAHKPAHRYEVEGFVLDANMKSRVDVEVRAKVDDIVIGIDLTDENGFFRLSLHLHNSDLGKQLLINAGKRKATIDIIFDPDDRESRRVSYLNFIGKTISRDKIDN